MTKRVDPTFWLSQQFRARPALFITLLYGLVGGLWILVSDQIVDLLFGNSDTLTFIQTYKGLGFVLITAGGLYLLLGWLLRERDQVERKLFEAEERMRQAVRAANVGLWDWNLLTNTVYYSPEWKRQLGYADDEISNAFAEWQSRVHPDDLDRALDKVKAQIARPQPIYSNEFRMRHKDGSYRWILAQAALLLNEQGKPVRMLGSHIDITERKQSEQALRESQRRFLEAQQIAHFGNWELHMETGSGYWSPEMFQIHGLDEASGPPPFPQFLQMIHPDDLQMMIAFDEQARQSLEPISATYRIIRSDGQIRHLQSIVQADLDKKRLMGTVLDITERLRTEMLQIELAHERALMALRERFVATASHDFRSPLAIIKMSTDMLKKNAEDMPAARRIAKLEQIDMQVDRMTALLDDVLTVSRANAGKIAFEPSLIDLEQFCRDIWSDFQMQAGAAHVIELVYQVDAKRVLLDQKLMHQVLVNLLSNAIKYSPGGGHIRFAIAQRAGDLCFEIQDEGIGIPEVDQKALFDPFHRAGNTQGIEGTGLGLSIVKTYVNTHRGTIDLHSLEGQGTTVTVCIPFTAGE